MEGLEELVVTSAVNGILNGFILIWNSLAAHPLLLLFLAILVITSWSIPKRFH